MKHRIKLFFSKLLGLKSAAPASTVFPIGAAGKTVLFFDEGHGNQVEFIDQNGRVFLWYPGNGIIVPGGWEVRGDQICFKYGTNTFNPVTQERGGDWEGSPVARWSESIIDIVSGDVFGLSRLTLPYKLPAKPKYESIAQMKSLRR